MGIISAIFNFDNIGGKIKGFVKWSCWITILLLWIATPILIIVAIAVGGDGAFLAVILYPIAAVITSFAIWVGSWAIYAFGEHIEDTKVIRYNTEIIAQPIKDTAAEKTQQKTNSQPISPKPIETARSTIYQARTDKPANTAYTEGEYVSGKTYYSGDEVIFEGKKYVCTAPNSTVWSPGVAPSQWQECSPSETEL